MLRLSRSSRVISVFLCLFFLLLTACGTTVGESETANSNEARQSGATGGNTSPSVNIAPTHEPQVSSGAKGRYVEQKIEIPAFVNISFSQTASGAYYLFGDIKTDAGYEYQAFGSTDGGNTWGQISPPWIGSLNENGDGWVGAAAFVSDTEAYLFLGNRAPDGSRQSRLAHADDSGVSVIGEPEQESISNLVVCANGDILVGTYSGTEQRNLESGKIINYPFVAGEGSARSPGVFTTYDNTLAVYTDENKIERYDLTTGEKTDDILCQANPSYDRVITVSTDRNSYFFCDPSGLYRMSMDGSLTELLMDGKLASFGSDDVVISRLVAQDDGSFLVICLDESYAYSLYKYTYDENAPTTPSESLTVYSLEENTSIHTAVRAFKQTNPNTLIEYQAGIPFGSELPAADAIRSLNTQLLAGSGPDVLVLDGLPIDSYMETGALVDLVPLLEPLSGQLLPVVIDTYGLGSGIYAVPTRVSIPIICTPEAEAFSDVEGLVGWLGAQDMQIMAEVGLELFYDVCSPKWFLAEDELDEERMRNDLEAIKAYQEIQQETPSERSAELRLMDQAAWWSGGGLAAMLGDLSSLDDFAYLYGATEANDGVVRLFPSEAEGGFLPRSALGINAYSQNMEGAERFITAALSREVQELPADGGVPVNTESIRAIMDSGDSSDTFARIVKMDSQNGKRYELNATWLSEENKEQVNGIIGSLTTPIRINRVLKEIVLEETAGYFSGSQNLDTAMSSLTQKLTLYLLEN